MSIWYWILYSIGALLVIIVPVILYCYCKSLCKKSKTPSHQRSPSHAINIRQAEPGEKRMIVIDGSNVAFRHSVDKEKFSVKGLSICIDYFQKRGHDVKAVVPEFRLKGNKSTDPETLNALYSQGIVCVTPSQSYDDRFVLDIAIEFDGVVISNDKFRDIINESDAYRKLIESRVVKYTWCNDMFMLPQDPYGRYGPKLNEILHKPRTIA